MRMRKMTMTRYEFLQLIDQGGFGEVWLVRDPWGRRLALKRLLQPTRTNLMALAKEIEKLVLLQGTPGVITILDYDLKGPEPYLAMELADGSLLDLIDGPMKPREAARIMSRLVKIVAETHRQGVVHRDIKPPNVLLKNGSIRLADFGLGKGAETLLLTIGGAGTPGYMAPEQFRGPVTWKADVFGLGATLYHLLTGSPPPVGRAVLSPRQAGVKVPVALDKLVQRMTAWNPDERPTLAEVLIGLRPSTAKVRATKSGSAADAFGALVGVAMGVGLVVAISKLK